MGQKDRKKKKNRKERDVGEGIIWLQLEARRKRKDLQ